MEVGEEGEIAYLWAMRVGILGAGTMGRGIAEVVARAGEAVVMYEPVAEVRAAAEAALRERLPGAQLAITGELTQLAGAEVWIEAIPEDLARKKALFAQIVPWVGPTSLVATNTSALSVHALGRDLPYRSRFLGWHFFNPAPRMPLVEVIPTAFTTEEAVHRSLTLLRAWGKVPVIAPDLPGFLVNRIARPYYVEALRAAEGGVSPEVIDQLMEGLGFRMGPFRLMDLIGVEVNHSVTQAVWEGLGYPVRFRPSWLQAQKIAAGHLGRKTGQGFYLYPTAANTPRGSSGPPAAPTTS
ncbi:MAG: hypothetical protein KatS3mg026_1811 [Bacteroidia bacterium]|nr:MAG: hypothetical protein KatS3mg026_1811 [Bacteroidia bacterium]